VDLLLGFHSCGAFLFELLKEKVFRCFSPRLKAVLDMKLLLTPVVVILTKPAPTA
jgi:hypothetical protein